MSTTALAKKHTNLLYQSSHIIISEFKIVSDKTLELAAHTFRLEAKKLIRSKTMENQIAQKNECKTLKSEENCSS